jgi:hypothetical protein
MGKRLHRLRSRCQLAEAQRAAIMLRLIAARQQLRDTDGPRLVVDCGNGRYLDLPDELRDLAAGGTLYAMQRPGIS